TDHHQRSWSALLVNAFFFFGISAGALFFYALQNATETAWSVLVHRVYEAIFGALPIGTIALVVVLLAASFHWNHLYHWMDGSLYHEHVIMDGDVARPAAASDPGAVANPNYDPIIAGKKAYLNLPFFWIRTIAYLGVFLFFAR